MGLFLINARDKAGSLDVRMANREAHLAYAKDHMDQIKVAGPVLNEAGDMAGSTLIMEFSSLEEAQNWASNDPYAKAGLFESVEIIAYKWLLGDGK
ncbi:MAG: YciI family protein [Pseudomonadota bacterium]